MHDKRNVNLIRGDSETWNSYRERLSEHVSKLEWQSEGHRLWYTHKNPYGCWICELLQIANLYTDTMLVGRESIGQGDDIDLDENYNVDDEE